MEFCALCLILILLLLLPGCWVFSIRVPCRKMPIRLALLTVRSQAAGGSRTPDVCQR